jgi:hypothetical protein
VIACSVTAQENAKSATAQALTRIRVHLMLLVHIVPPAASARVWRFWLVTNRTAPQRERSKVRLFCRGDIDGLFVLMAVPNRIINAIAVAVWVGLLYALFSWDNKRRKSSPPSRF